MNRATHKKHRTKVSADDWGWQAKCSCGWKGEWRPDTGLSGAGRAEAHSDVGKHVADTIIEEASQEP